MFSFNAVLNSMFSIQKHIPLQGKNEVDKHPILRPLVMTLFFRFKEIIGLQRLYG